MDGAKAIKARTTAEKMFRIFLIVVIVGSSIFAALYVIDIALSIGLELPLSVAIFVWVAVPWTALMYVLFYFLLDTTYIFTESEVIIQTKANLRKRAGEKRIRYDSMVNILYGKFSVLQIVIFMNLSRTGCMLIRHNEKSGEGEAVQETLLNIPYKKVKVIAETFGLSIKNVARFDVNTHESP